jgi:hypothetical protein
MTAEELVLVIVVMVCWPRRCCLAGEHLDIDDDVSFSGDCVGVHVKFWGCRYVYILQEWLRLWKIKVNNTKSA